MRLSVVGTKQSSFKCFFENEVVNFGGDSWHWTWAIIYWALDLNDVVEIKSGRRMKFLWHLNFLATDHQLLNLSENDAML